MQYADSIFYKNTYYGNTIPDDELERLLARASEKIDLYTYNRSREFSSLSLFEQEAIQKATCAEADAIYVYGDQDVNLGSYSIGDVSISGTTTQSILLSQKAETYLKNTRLTSAILR